MDSKNKVKIIKLKLNFLSKKIKFLRRLMIAYKGAGEPACSKTMVGLNGEIDDTYTRISLLYDIMFKEIG